MLRVCSRRFILRTVPYTKSASVVKALFGGGVRSIEVTMETNSAKDIIAETVEAYGRGLD